MTHRCIVCASTSLKPLYAGVVRCHHCGYVFADLGLTDEDLLDLYNDRFFCGGEYKDYLADKKVQKNFKLRFRAPQPFLEARHCDQQKFCLDIPALKEYRLRHFARVFSLGRILYLLGLHLWL